VKPTRQQQRADGRRNHKTALSGEHPREPWTIASGEVPAAKRHGTILGAAVCEDNHVVLVMGDMQGNPVIDCHMADNDVEMVIEMLRSAQRSRGRPTGNTPP
jgi:hypothetical protein